MTKGKKATLPGINLAAALTKGSKWTPPVMDQIDIVCLLTQGTEKAQDDTFRVLAKNAQFEFNPEETSGT